MNDCGGEGGYICETGKPKGLHKNCFFASFPASILARTYTPTLHTLYETDNVDPPCKGGVNDFFGGFQHNRWHRRGDQVGCHERFPRKLIHQDAWLQGINDLWRTPKHSRCLRRHVHQSTALNKNPHPKQKGDSLSFPFWVSQKFCLYLHSLCLQ